jgi:hypothetical protein
MFKLEFLDFKAGKVHYAINDVLSVRYITEREVGFIYMNGRVGSCPFLPTEHLEIIRVIK